MVTKRSGGDRSTGFRDLFNAYLSELGATVTRTIVTKTTSNIDGDETLTESTNESVVVYFMREGQEWEFGKEGQLEKGDAFMLIKSDQAMTKEDKITYEGEEFRVDRIINRYVANELNYKQVNLFLID